MARVVDVSLDSGQVSLQIDNAANTVMVTNQDGRDAIFNVFNAAVLNGQPAGSVVVWTYSQAAGTSATIPIPTTDNNGAKINWQVGNVTDPKTGVTSQTVTSPSWQLTMQA